jgi:steroid delta-isomerase-like uncharacterized protein
MQPIEIAQQYFDAWNRRAPGEIAALFADAGTYSDPTTGGPLDRAAIPGYAGALFAAFPDLHFTLESAAPTGADTVAAQWRMHGTNTAPLQGNPPTGRTVDLPGADFIQISGDKIRSVQGYFDQKAFLEQLGLRAILVPASTGAVSYGSSASVQPGKSTQPGAFSLTWMDVRSDEEERQVQALTGPILREIAQMPGFISFVGAIVGRRMYTITAWENAETPRQVMHSGAHKEAMGRFFNHDLGTAGHTSIWIPHTLNALWVRCTRCGKQVEYEKSQGVCACGEALPPPPPYW